MNNSQINKSCSYLTSGPDDKKSKTQRYWIKERLVLRLDKWAYEKGINGMVNLMIDIHNNNDRSWSDDVKIKGAPGSILPNFEQPLPKRVRSKNNCKVTLQLNMSVGELRKFLGQELTFELGGCDERKSTKFTSQPFKVPIEGALFGG